MTRIQLLLAATLLTAPSILLAQGRGISPAELLKPLKDSWPTYNGDYTGRRYSALTQIDRSTVKNLTLAWSMRVNAGMGNAGGGFGRGGRGGGGNIIVGGEGTGD